MAIPFDEEHGPVALAACRPIGKGRHPAARSFGDRLTSAIAMLAGEPPLVVGEDVARTDVVVAPSRRGSSAGSGRSGRGIARGDGGAA